MKQITEIDSDAKQNLIIIGENNERITFNIYYSSGQQSWFFDIEYLDFFAYGLKLVTAPNVLRRFRNVIPFGIMSYTIDGAEPYFIDDFEKGRVILYLLNELEVEEIEEDYYR